MDALLPGHPRLPSNVAKQGVDRRVIPDQVEDRRPVMTILGVDAACIILCRRPRESRDPYALNHRYDCKCGATLSFVIIMLGSYGSPPEPVIGPAKPDPLAGTTSNVWRRISSPLPVLTGRGRERSERVRGICPERALAPHPETSLRSVSDLSPQAGRGEASAPSALQIHFSNSHFRACKFVLAPRASWGLSLAPQTRARGLPRSRP